jgi:hypothetical protein
VTATDATYGTHSAVVDLLRKTCLLRVNAPRGGGGLPGSGAASVNGCIKKEARALDSVRLFFEIRSLSIFRSTARNTECGVTSLRRSCSENVTASRTSVSISTLETPGDDGR